MSQWEFEMGSNNLVGPDAYQATPVNHSLWLTDIFKVLYVKNPIVRASGLPIKGLRFA